MHHPKVSLTSLELDPLDGTEMSNRELRMRSFLGLLHMRSQLNTLIDQFIGWKLSDYSTSFLCTVRIQGILTLLRVCPYARTWKACDHPDEPVPKVQY